MENIEFNILNSENDIIEYEKAMYKSYSEKTPESLEMPELYEILDNCRMRPRGIDYKDLITYELKINDKIVAGLKINRSKIIFLNKMGFNIEEIDGIENVEGINFFTLADDYKVLDFINIMEDFSKIFIDDMKKRGIKILYGICDSKIKIVFLRIGFEIIEERQIGKDQILLIKFQFK